MHTEMKKIYSILAIAAFALGLASCTVKQEDAFSTDPVAPELAAHSDILVTDNTLGEDVNFSWTGYRNLPDGLTYTLMARFGESEGEVASTDKLYWKTTKADFSSKIYSIFPSLPENDTFSITFWVRVSNGGKNYDSAEVTISIYAGGDAVAPIIVDFPTDPIVLDPAQPTVEAVTITWEPARLVYGEAITYDVAISAENEAITTSTKGDDDTPVGADLYTVATGLTETSYTISVDELNEAIIAAGGEEAAAVEVTFHVIAKCESLPNGIATASDQLEVTTYVSTFPEVLYLPGSYQGWDPAAAPTLKLSTAVKGFYEGIVDLTTQDGSPVQFKFSPNPEWKDDFGGKVDVDMFAQRFSHAKGVVAVAAGDDYGSNIEVPSGVYNIAISKKFNTLEMIQVETVSMIGSAVGDYSWGADVDMTYDAAAKQFVVAETAVVPGEFKFRFNHDWTYSMGGTLEAVSSTTGENIASTKEGNYKVVLDVSTVPYNVKFINTSFPDQLYVPGSHNGWDHNGTIIKGDGEGHYVGFANVGGEWGFKLTPQPNWDAEWGLDKNVEPVVTTNDAGSVTKTVYALTDTGGGNIAEASEITYARVSVDLTALTVTVEPVSSVGIIGGFLDNAWSSDKYSMEYDPESNSWKAESVEIPQGTEWKFRMNEEWTINLGGSLDDLVQDGSNIVEQDGAFYDVELFIDSIPFHAVLTWKGGSDYVDVSQGPWSLIGTLGGTNWDTDFDMEKDGKIFTAKNVSIAASEQFKLRFDHGWAFNRGAIGETEPVTIELRTATAVENNGKNMAVAQDGSYDIYYDASKETITIVKAGDALEAKWSLIGAIGGTSWDTDFDMTEEDGKWVYSGIELTEGEEFKLRYAGLWDVNRGADADASFTFTPGEAFGVVNNGANIVVPRSGKYDVIYDPASETMTITPEYGWSLIGSFEGSDWSVDTDMVQEGGLLVAKGMTLKAGNEMKLRKGHDWAVNYGIPTQGEIPVGGPVALTSGSANMVIPEDGTFDVYFDESALVLYLMPEGMPVLSLIGEIGGTSWDKDFDLTLTKDATGAFYRLTSFAVEPSQQFKIRKNHDWTISWGGASSSSVELGSALELTSDNGSNLTVNVGGTTSVDITVNYGDSVTITVTEVAL